MKDYTLHFVPLTLGQIAAEKIQLANGTEGYLPTEKAEKGGHYSAFLASGLVGHAGGEQLVRETLKNINKLFAE